MPPDLALLSTLTGSNYLCLQLTFVVPKVFKPLKFNCTFYFFLDLDICDCFERGKSQSYNSINTVPYFFDYKTEFFSFQNNPKDLDPSCKMDLDLWYCLGRVKLVL